MEFTGDSANFAGIPLYAGVIKKSLVNSVLSTISKPSEQKSYFKSASRDLVDWETRKVQLEEINGTHHQLCPVHFDFPFYRC